ncbi:MAG TPA: fatty acid desaturase [Acidimicrobiales bacterium]|nr:fatty acid desaturase [Acidimicrobiales bacterium]
MATTFPAPLEAPATAPTRLDDAGADAEAGAVTEVGTVRAHTGVVSRLVTLVAMLVPPVGLVVALVQLWGSGVHAVDVALLVALYVAGGLGVTVGFHRLFSHRAFVAGPPVRAALAVLGSITLQGPVTQWVTDHRKHHAFSDRPGDPHSPHTSGGGARGALVGFFHAHVGWMFVTKGMERGEIYGRDLYADRLIRTIDRLYLVWVAVSLLVPFGVGWLVRGTVGGAVEALVWGGLLRIFLFHHATFCVNSVCHLFGRRPYETRDRSRNNWFVALLTFGEGWHNNHHGFPRSARLGLTGAQLDPGWWLVRGLERAGLAAGVRTPRPGGARVS